MNVGITLIWEMANCLLPVTDGRLFVFYVYFFYSFIFDSILWFERYWHSVIGYWAIFADIGLLGDIFFIETPNTIPIRQQSAPST